MPTIEDGQQAVEQGNLQQARLIFEAILQETPRSEEAWLGLAEVLTDTDDKRICYENVLKINKDNREAREALRNLEPQADPLIEALQPKAEPGDEDEIPGADDTIVSAVPDETVAAESAAAAEVQAADSPPTFALVAVGLLLSVVFFAVGGGLIFFFLSAVR